MVSLILPTFAVSSHSISCLSLTSCFPIVFVVRPLKGQYPRRFKRKLFKENKLNPLFEFPGFGGVVRKCKNWEGEGDPGLELEVLEFMKNSMNPRMFPSKTEMIEAGRKDLVDAIVKRGGWMTAGWGDEESEDGLATDLGVWLGKYGKNSVENGERSGLDANQERHFEGIFLLGDYSLDASSSGRSLGEMAAEEESGIEGILHRLERHRNLTLGFKLGKNGTGMDSFDGDTDDKNQNKGLRKDVDSCHPQTSKSVPSSRDRTLTSGNGLNRSYPNRLSSSLKTDTWRSWSIQRAGFCDSDFEAGEIDFGENCERGTVDNSMGEIIALTSDFKGAQDKSKFFESTCRQLTQGDLKNRLQHLETELSSVFHSLRSNSTELTGKVNLSEDLRQLSDVSEFQETEMMNCQDKLRTLRAKLAVLEGKMSLAITDAQNILDKKQEKINDARRALQLLRTTCIVWPNSGSEVLLAGSFDGWANQRKMNRSSTGIFSLSLKLYPGKYEIKFIVDGVWKVDPLRPVVNNNGFENNLLTVT